MQSMRETNREKATWKVLGGKKEALREENKRADEEGEGRG